jgi:Dockerin type I domain/Calx-beta domain/Planctomycete extracellular
MQRRFKRYQTATKRRRLMTESLEDRRLLAALDFVPATGTVSEENGVTVVTVAPGETINVAAQIISSESSVLGFQLNLAASDEALTLGNFSNGDFPAVTDNTLNSAVDDFLVASGIFTGPLSVPPTRLMGSFDVTAPNTPNDYLLTSNQVIANNDDSMLSDSVGNSIPISEFGDLVIRVVDSTQLPRVQLNRASQSVSEDAGVVTIIATLSQSSASDVTVPFTVSGNATEGDDYSITGSPITIPAGQTSATISVTIADDSDVESPETIVVTLGTPTGANLGATTVHTVTVEDNDTVVGTGLTLDLVPAAAAGTISEENGQTVITVAPGAKVNVSALILQSSAPVIGFQLNLSASASTLVLDNFVNGVFLTSTDDVLNSTANDYQVASGVFPDPLSIPPNRLIGTFDVTAPSVANDYELTANFVQGQNNDTIFSDAAGNPITISNFGDLIIRVVVPPPVVNFTVASQSVNEEAGTFTVTAQLSAAAASDVTLPFTVSGTADSGDYTVATTSITIAAGQTSGNITVNVTDDTVDEPDETVVITLSTPVGATLGSSVMHTATIEDNDNPTLSFSTASQTAAESSGTATITVSLSAASDTDVTVPFTVAGNALNPADYSITTSPITIAAGQTSASITVNIVDDTSDEPNETVVVTLGTPTGANLGAATVHTLTITDNDEPIPPSVTLSSAGQTVAESAGTITFTATLSAASTTAVVLPFTLTGNASSNDFTITTSPLTIPAGQTSGAISITVVDDTTDESVESVVVTLGTPTGATLGATTVYTLVVTDNDDPPLPTVAFSVANQSVDENAGSISVTATLSTISAADVVVPFTIAGSATSASDFTTSASPLTIIAGQTSASITLNVIDDPDDELDEEILITLNSATGATLGSIAAQTVTIVDNDPAGGTPTVEFSVASQSVGESVGTFVVTASLSHAATIDVTIPFSVAGTADAGDFSSSASPLTILAGQTSAAISITVIDDSRDEPDERIELTLQNPTGAMLGATVVHTATILDNDEPAPIPAVNFALANQSRPENVGTITVAVTLSNAADTDVTIPFTVAGSAVSGSDFTIAATSITIPMGSTTGHININVIDDTVQEPNRTVVLTLGAPTGGTLGDSIVHVVTINDDETVSNGDNRIIIPNFVARPHLIPGDGRPTAILFRALVDTVLTVSKVNVLSLTEQITLLDRNLESIGGVDSTGTFQSNLTSGGLYALIIQPQAEEAIFVIRSSEGFDTLAGSSTNLLLPTDVNADGESTALDALMVINHLRQQSFAEGEELPAQSGRYYDVNRDGSVTASDVLRIINKMAEDNVSKDISPISQDPDTDPESPITLDPNVLNPDSGKVTLVDLSRPMAVVDLTVALDTGQRVDEVLGDEVVLDELLASLQ